MVSSCTKRAKPNVRVVQAVSERRRGEDKEGGVASSTLHVTITQSLSFRFVFPKNISLWSIRSQIKLVFHILCVLGQKTPPSSPLPPLFFFPHLG